MKINKTLSQEEQTIVKNIQSLIKELLSATGAKMESEGVEGQPVIENPEQISTKSNPEDLAGKAEEEMTEEEKLKKAEEDKEKDDDEKAEKARVLKDQTNTPSDVATANDDAEDRLIDALSEVDETNVDEVSKAIRAIKALKAQRNVQKSFIKSPVMQAVSELAQVVKAVIQNQNNTDQAVTNILNGLGITEQLQTIMKSETERKPIVDNDNQKGMEYLQKLLGGVVQKSEGAKPEGGQTVLSNGQIVQKNINGMMSGIFANIPGLRR